MFINFVDFTSTALPACVHSGMEKGAVTALALRSRSQPPLGLQALLHRLEHQAIHQVPEQNDQYHNRDYLAHVVQVASHH